MEKKIPKIPVKLDFVNVYLMEGKEVYKYMWGMEIPRSDFEYLDVTREVVFKTTEGPTIF